MVTGGLVCDIIVHNVLSANFIKLNVFFKPSKRFKWKQSDSTNFDSQMKCKEFSILNIKV